MQSALNRFFRLFFWAAMLATAAGVCSIAGRTIGRRMLRDVQDQVHTVRQAVPDFVE